MASLKIKLFTNLSGAELENRLENYLHEPNLLNHLR